jgi:hypothetical protein
MIAHLTSRTPAPAKKVKPVSDTVPWGTPYTGPSPAPLRPLVPAGSYTLDGKAFGSAQVQITHDAVNTFVSSVSVSYTNYSDDGFHVINGTESVSLPSSGIIQTVTWHSSLMLSGCQTGTKVTSEPGGLVLTEDEQNTIFTATGTLATTVDGTTYSQPLNGT